MTNKQKKSFTLLELIFLVVIIATVSAIIIPKKQHSSLQLAAQQIIMYLKYTRYLALVDNKYIHQNDTSKNKNEKDQWYKSRWTLKFQNCTNNNGLYFVVYSDDIDYEEETAHFKKSECAKDLITSRWLYSDANCVASNDESKYVLLTKQYGVTQVTISCNQTSTIGKISFDENGQAHSLIDTLDDDILNEVCYIKLFDATQKFVKIAITSHTGYIYQIFNEI